MSADEYLAAKENHRVSSPTVRISRPVHFMCPTVTVACPEETEAGTEISFTVTVAAGTPVPELKYNWTTDQGTIAFGQGTPRIKVDRPAFEGKTITATVEVNGIVLRVQDLRPAV